MGAPDVKRRRSTAERKAELERRRQLEEEAQANAGVPWRIRNQGSNWMQKEAVPSGLSEEEQAQVRSLFKKKKQGEEEGEAGPREDKSVFHGKAEADYLGRSWLEGPKERRPEVEQCYLPKKLVHSWAGHTKGVQKVEWFPGTAHLMLSAGLDGKVKIWDVFGDRRCMRTYIGHDKGVRDICFSNDGRRFISSSFDKTVKVRGPPLPSSPLLSTPRALPR